MMLIFWIKKKKQINHKFKKLESLMQETLFHTTVLVHLPPVTMTYNI